MALDADAQAAVDLMGQAFPNGLHSLPIEQTRAMMAEGVKVTPPGPDVAKVEDRMVPAEGHEIPVRIYWPSQDKDLPALVWLHGGAFALGSLDGSDVTGRDLTNAGDVVVISVDYRLAPEHKFPAGLEDSYRVLQWAAENAAELGIDASRLAIGGDSAGGNLAAAACLMARDRGGPEVAFQLLVYPTTLMRVSSYEYADDPIVSASMATFFWRQYLDNDAQMKDPYCAPMMAETLEGLPPAFVVVPEVDSTRADQEAYAHRLASSGVLTTVKVYPGTPHGFFGMTQGVAKAREAMADAGRILRTHLGGGR